MSFPKTKTWRNPKILKAAQEAPHCMCCSADNHGNVVAAHANWSEYGKGMGTKAHDWAIAYVCDRCHAEIDAGMLGRVDKREVWRMAHVRTLEWLFETGRLGTNG